MIRTHLRVLDSLLVVRSFLSDSSMFRASLRELNLDRRRVLLDQVGQSGLSPFRGVVFCRMKLDDLDVSDGHF